ncbi:MAG: polysaccharide deacetylase family protein [Methylophilaceae bacterium]
MPDNQPAPWRPPLLIKLSVLLHGLALLAVVIEPDLWKIALTPIIANHVVISFAGLWPRSNWLGPNWTRLPAAAARRNEIALTIDDGPDPEVTPQVLDILDRFQAKATFFCIGNKAQHHAELCREIVQRGHAVENHSQRHWHNFSLLGLRAYTREIQAAQQTLTAITGVRPQFFRAPAGLRNPFLDPVLKRLGLRLVSWSVRGFDTQVKDADKVRNKLLAGLQPGAILLLHDGNAARTSANIPVILAVLPELLQAAQAAKLRPVTLQQASS